MAVVFSGMMILCGIVVLISAAMNLWSWIGRRLNPPQPPSASSSPSPSPPGTP
jgi:hypothetical protein